jgi:hypothetical protein
MSKMLDSVNDLKQAFTRGAQDVKRAVGIEDDPDVALYNRMTPEHLKKMREQYGLDNVVEYIQDMEYRKATKR